LIEIGLVAFTALFATIGPVDVAAIFAAITKDSSPAERRRMALRGTLIGAGILTVIALIGEALLQQLGITLAALRTAGGILLLLMGIDMVFARHSGATSTTSDETEEATTKTDISVFPLATPLLAGPGAMGAVILLMADAGGDHLAQAVVIAALLANFVIALVLLLMAGQLSRLLGVTGLNVITRVVGVLLSALAVQFIFDGIKGSGLLG
jgi:multiple antibiotic resistance protein